MLGIAEFNIYSRYGLIFIKLKLNITEIGLLFFFSALVLLLAQYSYNTSFGIVNISSEIARPWYGFFSEDSNVPIKLLIENNENSTHVVEIVAISRYLDATDNIVKRNQESVTLLPLSKNNITTQTGKLFEGKWITELQLKSSGKMIYDNSFLIEITSLLKAISTNVIPLTAIGSSAVAIVAVVLQYKNSTETQRNMNKQIKLLETELDLNTSKTVTELRPWIYKIQQKGIREVYAISPGENKVTFRVKNFGKSPALDVKYKTKVENIDPSGTNFFYDDMFDFRRDKKSANLGHLMPNQEIPLTFIYETKVSAFLILIEIEYSYFTDGNGLYRMVIKIINEFPRPTKIEIEFEKAI